MSEKGFCLELKYHYSKKIETGHPICIYTKTAMKRDRFRSGLGDKNHRKLLQEQIKRFDSNSRDTSPSNVLLGQLASVQSIRVL